MYMKSGLEKRGVLPNEQVKAVKDWKGQSGEFVPRPS
jgi:hypothetical protein